MAVVGFKVILAVTNVCKL